MSARGGARPNAGRKPNSVKYEEPLASFHDSAAEDLPLTYANLRALADGKCQRITRKRKRAGTIFRKDVLRDGDKKPIADSRGKYTIIEVLVYPELDSMEWVTLDEDIIDLPPDFKSNELFIDRLGGKPKQAFEHSGEDGGPIPIEILTAIDRLFPGDDACTNSEDDACAISDE